MKDSSLVRLICLGTVAAAALIASDCGSTCASNCPPYIFNIYAPPGENLNILSAPLTGPACPTPQEAFCASDQATGRTCVYMTIIAAQPGSCRLDLTFNDGRAPFSVTAEFGPETHQGCCHGLPVQGPDVITIPPLHGPPPDAGTDAGAGPDDATDTGAIDTPAVAPDADAPIDSNNGAA